MFSKIFINRPRLALVLSLVMVLAGVLSIGNLPVEEYPNITPPQMYVLAQYPGASSQVIRDTVAFPIEDAINGVDDVVYFNSNCDNNGMYFCMITFKSGKDPDMALVSVQNAIKRAEPRLPTQVTRIGVNIMERSNDMLCMYTFTTDGRSMSPMELSNYVAKNVKDIVQRVDGVSAVEVMGARNYAMRLWLDPMRMSALGISSAEIMSAVNDQNAQAVTGTLGSEGSSDFIQMKIDTIGRLTSVDEFENIVVRTSSDGSVVRLRDVCRVELGAQDYKNTAKYNGEECFVLQIYRDSTSNSLETMDRLQSAIDDIKSRLPDGVNMVLGYNPNESIGVTMKETIVTLVSALILVVLITYLFLQDWRATIIPSLAIPVSLMATFPCMIAAGFSINVLTMFGLILVIGSLVDDAIVVVEGTMAIIEREHCSPKEAAIKCMSQITGAIIATTLVTVACYMPLAFYGGMVGTIYLQFAVTMCIALCFSTLVAMTLSPALCAMILRSHSGKAPSKIFAPVNFILDGSRKIYLSCVGFLVRRGIVTIALLAAVFGCIYLVSRKMPSSFLPSEDKSVILCNVELPPEASLSRTEAVLDEFRDKIKDLDGVENTVTVSGFGFISGAGENAGLFILDLKHWDERKTAALHAQTIMGQVQAIGASIKDAQIICFTPPSIQGLGATGGITFNLCCDGEVTAEQLDITAKQLARRISADRDRVLYASSTFSANSPQVYLKIDREKAFALGLTVKDIFFTLEGQIASYYINDFNIKGESFYVTMQTGKSERGNVEDIMKLQIPCSKTGELVPLSAIASLEYNIGAKTLQRFNKMSSAKIQVQNKPGVPSVVVMDEIEKIVKEEFPANYHVEWVDMSYHEQGNRGRIGPLFALAVLFAYLFLVGQYESWTIPIPVMLTVATATLGALIGISIMKLDLSIYAQLGLIMLVGLTAKNAILMVEFSKQERDHGIDIQQAAMNGASLRYRAVLMTAWSFIFGVLPLVLPQFSAVFEGRNFVIGAGTASRVAIGVPTFFGMLVATFIGIIITPALYSVFQRFREWFKHLIHMKTAAEKYAEEHMVEVAKDDAEHNA